MKLRHKFAEVEAFEFTQAMHDKAEPIPGDLNVKWSSKPGRDPMLEHGNGNGSYLSVGCWVMRNKEGECAVYYKKEYMMQDFSEVPG